MVRMDFEGYMKELEIVVKSMESSDNTLQQSLDLFEKGVFLTKKCQDILDKSEQKVNILLKDKDGIVKEQNFALKEE